VVGDTDEPECFMFVPVTEYCQPVSMSIELIVSVIFVVVSVCDVTDPCVN